MYLVSLICVLTMSGSILKHCAFLRSLYKNPSNIRFATSPQVSLLVNIVYNIFHNEKVSLTKAEHRILSKEITLVSKISKLREVTAARSALRALSPTSLKTLITVSLTVSGCKNAL